jgi:hypothetical protein
MVANMREVPFEEPRAQVPRGKGERATKSPEKSKLYLGQIKLNRIITENGRW